MFLLDGCLLSLSINFMNLLVRVNCLHLWHVLATLYIILTEPCNYIHQKHSFFSTEKGIIFGYINGASNEYVLTANVFVKFYENKLT